MKPRRKMEIVDCEQGSPEWDEIRAKRMTASQAQAIGNCGKGLDTYITDKMMDIYSSGEKKQFKSGAMEQGNELEDSAGFVYEADTGIKTEKVGFVIYSESVGCSPDLFAEDENGKGLVEIKCPEDKEYFRRLLGGAIESKYIWQMQMQMMICDLPWCDHVNYNPNFPKILLVDRIFADDKKQYDLSKGFFKGEKLMNEIEQKMEALNVK